MPPKLIINADDFGLTPGVNRTIAALFRRGALSSTTLMASGPAAADAIAIARAHPGLGVGCHIVLTDGTPVSDPARIPSLLGPDGRHLRPSLATFAAAALLGRLSESEIEREAEAQVSLLQRAGITVTHLDTHKHTHILPRVLRPLLRVARRLGVPAVRNPFEPVWAPELGHGSRQRRLQLRLLSRLRSSFLREIAAMDDQVVTTDGTVGISATGDLDSGSLGELLDNLPPGTWELVCHPGENDPDLDRISTRLRRHREIERDALSTLVPAWLRSHPEATLTHFGHLASSTPPDSPGSPTPTLPTMAAQ